MVQEVVDAPATAAARIEEAVYPNAVILPKFPCGIQLDYHPCGAKSVHTIFDVTRSDALHNLSNEDYKQTKMGHPLVTSNMY